VTRAKGLAGLYPVVMKAAVQTQFQYRTANYAYLLGMVAEPVVYLVVWSAVAPRAVGPFRASRRESSPRTTSSGRWSGT